MGRGEILDPIGRGRSRDWADGSRHVPGWIGGDRGGRRLVIRGVEKGDYGVCMVYIEEVGGEGGGGD